MSSKTIATVVIMLIIGGVITALAFMFGDIGNSPQISSSKNSNNIQSEKQATNTSTTDKEQYKELTFPNNTLDTSDWETYRNEKFGFAVDHPEGWEVRKSTDSKTGTFDPKNPNYVAFVNIRNPKDPYADITVSIYTDPLNETVKKEKPLLFKDPSSEEHAPKVRHIQLNGMNGVRFYSEADPGSYRKVYILGGDEISFIIRGSVEYDVFEQMLLSFRVTK